MGHALVILELVSEIGNSTEHKGFCFDESYSSIQFTSAPSLYHVFTLGAALHHVCPFLVFRIEVEFIQCLHSNYDG